LRHLVVSRDAEADFEEILRSSADRFGEVAAHRYRRLIQQAYADLQFDPERPTARRFRGALPALYVYAIRHSRTRLPLSERVGSPRHLIAFRFDNERVQIVRILHDSMDLPRHLRDVPPLGPGSA
jgi:toxin ParE1/3/4